MRTFDGAVVVEAEMMVGAVETGRLGLIDTGVRLGTIDAVGTEKALGESVGRSDGTAEVGARVAPSVWYDELFARDASVFAQPTADVHTATAGTHTRSKNSQIRWRFAPPSSPPAFNA